MWFLVVLAGSLLFVTVFAFCARDKRVMTWVGIALFATGFYIYFTPETDHAANKALEAANSTLSAFYPSRGSYDDLPCGNHGGREGDSDRNVIQESEPAGDSIAYWLFHLAAIFYILVLAISFFCIEFLNSIILRLHRWLRRLGVRRRPMNVFWNYGTEAETLGSPATHGC